MSNSCLSKSKYCKAVQCSKILWLDKNKPEVAEQTTRDEILDSYGILKCSIADFKNILKEDIISYKKNRYDYEILIANRKEASKKYKNMVIDKITLEDLMVLMIKGVK